MAIQNNTLAMQAASGNRTSPLVQWVGGAKGAAPSDGTPDPASFLAALNELLQGQQTKDGSDSADVSLMLALSNIQPEWLLALLSQASGSDLEQMASGILQMLQKNPQLAGQWLENSDSVRQWMAQAAAIFGSASAQNGASVSMRTLPDNSGNGSVELKQMMGLVKQLIAGLQQNPDDPDLQMLGNALRQAVQQPLQKPGTSLLPFNESAVGIAFRGQGLEKPAVAGSAGKSSPSASDRVALIRTFAGWTASVKGAESSATGAASSMLVQAVRQQPAVSTLLSAMEAKAGLLFQTVSSGAESSGPMQSPLPHAMDSEADLFHLPLQNGAAFRLAQSEPLFQAQPQSSGPLMNAQYFAQEMAQYMMKNMKVSQFNGISEAKITLVPENLGQVDVRITMHNGQLTAQFFTGTLHGREALEAQMSQLRLSLQNQGIQVQKLEVAQQNQVQHNPMQSNVFQEQRQSSSHQFGKQGKNSGSDRYDQMIDEFSEILGGDDRLQQLAYGGSFHVMA